MFEPGCTPANKGKGVTMQWLRDHANYAGNDCLRWPFSIDGFWGRGRVGHDGENLWAHREMCKLAHGEPPTPKHQAAHNCGKGHEACVNPRHLEWKTNSENQLDRRRHGTQAGAKGARTKLTPIQIADIRASKGVEPQVRTAARIGVKRGTIEYWQRLKRDPRPPGTSASAIRRRAAYSPQQGAQEKK